MKLSKKIKNIAKKVISYLPEKQKYHTYKYSTSVHISHDVDAVLKGINIKNTGVVKNPAVLQKIH